MDRGLMSSIPKMLVFAALAAGAGAAHAAAPPDGAIRASDPDPGARWELTASLTGVRSSSRPFPALLTPAGPLPQPVAIGWSAGVGEQATGYVSALRDDGSPYSLQPFLQRASTFTVDVSATHSNFYFPPNPTTTTSEGGAGGGVHIYVKPWLILIASINYEYVWSHYFTDSSEQLYSGTAGLGFRWRDSSLELSYNQVAVRFSGAFAPLQRGPVLLTLTTVVNRCLLASLTAEAIQGGMGGALAGTYFPTPRLGLMMSALAVQSRFSSDAPTVTQYTGTVGITAWRNRTAGVTAQYSFLTERSVEPGSPFAMRPSNSDAGGVAHTVVLQVFMRVR
jgi:hypothetical protein